MLGNLPPGSQLTEAEAAARLQVSRGPVREALQRLVQEGLLKAVRNRGVFVPKLGSGDVVDVYLAREAIEKAAARVLIEKGSTGLEATEQVLQRMASAAKRGRWSNLAQLDFEFHQSLVKASGSPRLARMLGTLMVESRLCVLALEGAYRASADLVEEHRQLFEAIRRGDQDVTEQRITEHMQDAAHQIRRLFALRTATGLDGKVVTRRAKSASPSGAASRKRKPSSTRASTRRSTSQTSV